MLKLKQGDTVVLSGDSAEFGLDDYNVRVSTTAVVLETPKNTAKKILVNISEIDGDTNVTAHIHRNKIKQIV